MLAGVAFAGLLEAEGRSVSGSFGAGLVCELFVSVPTVCDDDDCNVGRVSFILQISLQTLATFLSSTLSFSSSFKKFVVSSWETEQQHFRRLET